MSSAKKPKPLWSQAANHIWLTGIKGRGPMPAGQFVVLLVALTNERQARLARPLVDKEQAAEWILSGRMEKSVGLSVYSNGMIGRVPR